MPNPTQRRAAAPRAKTSSFFRGEEGMRKTDEELALAKQRQEERRSATNAPFRFYVTAGESKQAIICDEKPDFFMYEHGLRDSEGRWGRLFCGCIKSHDICPVCESVKESYYGMYLTVIDLTPFTTRDGETVEFSRKLLVIKPAQQKKFLRMYQKEGTLRGALIEFTRDGEKDASIGNDFEIVEFVPEEEMQTYVRTWTDQQNKEHTEYCDEPYVYEEIFEEPTVSKLRALVGGGPTPGSREHDGTARPSRGREPEGRRQAPPVRGRAREAAAEDDWSPAGDDAAFDADPPRRGRAAPPPRRGATPPPRTAAPAPRRGRAAPEQEPDPEPPARATARRGRAAPEPEVPARAPARRGRVTEPLEDDIPY